jgi:hypothetical protein
MADLSQHQFGGYSFHGVRKDTGHVEVVARTVPVPGRDPQTVGALSISTDRYWNQEAQENINAPLRPGQGGYSHGTTFERIPGQRNEGAQMRWQGGNFESDDPHVQWLGVESKHRKPTVLGGMAGVAFHLHGGMPYADQTLSPEGAAVSKHMVEKYGMKPHPKNPTMEASWDPMDEYEPEWDRDYDEPIEPTERERAEFVDNHVHQTNSGYNYSVNNPREGDKVYGEGDPSVKDLVRGLRSLRPAKPASDKPRVHQGQQRLF